MQAKLASVAENIAKAEHDLQLNRELMTDFEIRRNEVTLRLEILKTTASQSAILGIQTVSAQNRMTIVDSARKARVGKPGRLVIGVTSLFLSGLVIGGWLVVDYANRKQ